MLDRLARLLRHRWFDEGTLRRALPAAAMRRLTDRVQASEKRHSGEVRIYIEAALPNSYLWRKASLSQVTRQRALTMFGKLRVWDTEHNNGVLIYLLLAERAIEIVADRGLARQVSATQWQTMIDDMREAFRESRFEDGLNQAVDAITDLLARHFPQPADAPHVNELPDAPVIGPQP